MKNVYQVTLIDAKENSKEIFVVADNLSDVIGFVNSKPDLSGYSVHGISKINFGSTEVVVI